VRACKDVQPGAMCETNRAVSCGQISPRNDAIMPDIFVRCSFHTGPDRPQLHLHYTSDICMFVLDVQYVLFANLLRASQGLQCNSASRPSSAAQNAAEATFTATGVLCFVNREVPSQQSRSVDTGSTRSQGAECVLTHGHPSDRIQRG
jgi:hypothetical protein